MNKRFIMILLAALLFSLTLIGCGIPNEPDPSEIIPESTPKSEVISVIIPEEELVYKNEIAGYQITFPENWRGYYVVTEYSTGNVCVGFYGKSKTGQIAYKHHGYDGLNLFWITTNPGSDGYSYKLGEINGVEYSCSKEGGLYIGDLGGISEQHDTYLDLARYEVDEVEIELAAQDWEIAKPMRDDVENKNIIFAPIQ